MITNYNRPWFYRGERYEGTQHIMRVDLVACLVPSPWATLQPPQFKRNIDRRPLRIAAARGMRRWRERNHLIQAS